jgi:CRISPR system Cascade subunit CasA
MRLLICIAQAALDGPRDREEWKTCRARLPAAAADYLARWKRAFELFGDGQRFLQVENVKASSARETESDASNPPSKLDLALATGNNTTLFDNAGGSDRRFSPDDLALALLTFQNFSPGGLIGDVSWHGVSMGRSSTHAPCVVRSMVHTYIVRSSLVDGICANMLSAEEVNLMGAEWGRPVWEWMPDGPKCGREVGNATRSYLGRLVPLSRALRLDSHGTRMILGKALDYDPTWREAAATWVLRERNGEMERMPLSASLSKGLWRDAHAIAVAAAAERQALGGPLAMMSSAETAAATDVWCGALVANKSKLIDTVESVLHIPAPMFADRGQRLYRQGVEEAERWGRRIGGAVAAYRRAMKDDLERKESRIRGILVKRKAATHYWTAVEQKLSLLLGLLDDPSPLRPDGAEQDRWGATGWGRALAAAAREAYEMACPRETPRQLRAYAAGMSALFAARRGEGDGADSPEESEE